MCRSRARVDGSAPVQVVEHEQVPLAGRDPGQGPGDGLEAGEPVGAAGPVGPHQRHRLGQPVIGPRLGERAQDTDPRPQRGRAIVGRAATHVHAETPCAGADPELFGEPGLADAGFTDQQGDPHGAGLGVVEHAQQRGQLAFAADERGAGPDGDRAGHRHGGRQRGRVGSRSRPGSRHRSGDRAGGDDVLAQDRQFQLPHQRARVDAELGVQGLPDGAQRVQGIPLPPGPGQGEREQRPEVLAQRMVVRDRTEIGHHGGFLAQGQVQAGPIGQGGQAQVGQPGPFGVGRRVPVQLGIRLGAPPGQRPGQLDGQPGQRLGGQSGRNGQRIGAGEPGMHVLDHPGEAMRIDGIRRNPQFVAGGRGEHGLGGGARGPARFQHLAQAGDVGVQRRGDCGRRRPAPQEIDQGVDGHRTVGMQRQRGEQGPRFG